MKKKTRKMVLLTGVLCMLSLAVCACGKTEEPQDAAEPQVVQGEPIPEDDTKEEDSTPEPSAETEGTGGEDKQESPGQKRCRNPGKIVIGEQTVHRKNSRKHSRRRKVHPAHRHSGMTARRIWREVSKT